jgi:isohexenylglutaconyl-CoA hydratase
VVGDIDAANVALDAVLADIRACAPGANAATKQLLAALEPRDMNAVAEQAAQLFADCLLSDEGVEGTQAFREKRAPRWAEK